MSANYLQATGPILCVRCEYQTDHLVSYEMQERAFRVHLDTFHANWQGVTRPQSPTYYTHEQVVAMLKAAIFDAGSQKAWAEQAGISEQYLTDALKGRRNLGGKILAALGLRHLDLYERA